MSVLCPYCGEAARLISGQVAYPHRPDLWTKQFWDCRPCGARVGCHGNTSRPLGRLANTKLRIARGKAHAALDPLYHRGPMSRSKAYAWLARELGIDREACHIGGFDLDQCKQVVEVCRAGAFS
jgi:hypothetical protein